MANRSDETALPNPLQLLVQARAEQVRAGQFEPAPPRAEPAAAAATDPAPAYDPATPYDPAAIAARIDLMRGRFAKARDDLVSALLFLGDAQQDCTVLTEACAANRWTMMASGVALLSDSLRRALPSEARHLDLIGLQIDALYALRRAESRPDMGRAGADLLRGLKLAINRELPATYA